jgi:hypothetical protein
MAMPAVIAGDHIVGAQQRAHANRHRLLPGAEMHQAGDHAPGIEIGNLFFKGADQLHAVEQPQGLFR